MNPAIKEDISGMQPNVGRAAIDDQVLFNLTAAKCATVAVVPYYCQRANNRSDMPPRFRKSWNSAIGYQSRCNLAAAKRMKVASIFHGEVLVLSFRCFPRVRWANKAPEPTLGIGGFRKDERSSNTIAGVAHL